MWSGPAPRAVIAMQVHLFQGPDVVVGVAAPARCAVGQLLVSELRHCSIRGEQCLGQVRGEAKHEEAGACDLLGAEEERCLLPVDDGAHAIGFEEECRVVIAP